MKRSKSKLVTFKVKQAVGSMAIEGIRLSRSAQAEMIRVASGRKPAESVKEALIAKYRQVPTE